MAKTWWAIRLPSIHACITLAAATGCPLLPALDGRCAGDSVCPCATHADCAQGAEGFCCDEEAGICVPPSSTEQRDGDGTCRTTCASDASCGTGEVCASTLACTTGGGGFCSPSARAAELQLNHCACSTDADCPAGELCRVEACEESINTTCFNADMPPEPCLSTD